MHVLNKADTMKNQMAVYQAGLGPITKAWLQLWLRLHHDYQEWLRLRLQSKKADYDYDYKTMITVMIMITCSNEMFLKEVFDQLSNRNQNLKRVL